MARKILVVDDEKLIVKGIRFGLEQDGMKVDAAYDGEEALEMVKSCAYDIILLDLMLPKMNGFEVCQQIREFSDVPIIMLTAKGEDIDKIMGLEYGADDYMTKPFNILEVKARIKAILRRNEKNKVVKESVGKTLYGEMGIDFEDENKVYSREKLLDIIWGSDYPGDVRTVDVHIRRLREKIEETPGEPRYIHTKWGVGYYFKN